MSAPVHEDGLLSRPPLEGGSQDGAILTYVDAGEANWSADLETLHEESSRNHFLDVATRRAISERLPAIAAGDTIVDLGCSTGHLLVDLQREHRDARLVGVDMVRSGLRKARLASPGALLLQADACNLPLGDGVAAAVASANLLEHVPDDVAALRETHRILAAGGRAVFVVPAGPGTYDYYDRFLGHERRYGRGELATKARQAGLEVVEDTYLGVLLFPAFWLVKKRNRLRHPHLHGDALERRVHADIAGTSDSRIGRASVRLEAALGRRGVPMPFGVRGLTTVRRSDP